MKLAWKETLVIDIYGFPWVLVFTGLRGDGYSWNFGFFRYTWED
jgi:hypothetical protein